MIEKLNKNINPKTAKGCIKIGESLLVTPCRNKEASKSRDLRQSKRFEQEDKELKMEVEKSGFVEVPKLQPYKISPAMARHAFEFELISSFQLITMKDIHIGAVFIVIDTSFKPGHCS